MNASELRTDRAADADEDADLPLSVVVITENEADRIAGCLESVIAAAERAVPAFEVVLVDSASTDRTVAVASDYPVTVLRIPPEETVSCGAGRHVGDQVARGELVCHVDGDMRLTETWLSEAVEYLRSNPDVAGVEGWLNESEASDAREVRKVGGVTCYDGGALASVGGFDPFLHGYEDVDVGHRLTVAGHRLVRLPSISAEHPTGEGSLTEPIRRWRHGYLFAPGQAIRKSLRRPRVLRLLLARQRYEAILLAWLVLGLASLASPLLLIGWFGTSVLAFGALSKRRGVRGALQFGLAKVLGLVGLAYGLTLETPSRAAFPLASVEVVQEGAVLPGRADGPGADTGAGPDTSADAVN